MTKCDIQDRVSEAMQLPVPLHLLTLWDQPPHVRTPKQPWGVHARGPPWNQHLKPRSSLHVTKASAKEGFVSDLKPPPAD